MRAGWPVKAAVAAVAAVALLEAGLRFGVGLGNPPLARLDPVTEYEHVGPAVYRRWGNRIEINTQGLRMPPMTDLPEAEDRRVLLVGDSVIYGNHFLDQSKTIAARMTALFRNDPRFAACSPVVLPVAASSWGPVNQAAFLGRDGTFGAVAAGIVVSGHDLYDVPRDGARILPYRTAAPVGAIGDAVKIVLERTFPAPITTAPQPRDLRERMTRDALDRMTDQLRQQGIAPVLFYHPTLPERDAPPSREARAFEDWAATRSVPFVDLGSVPLGADAYRDTIHPNPAGTTALAQALFAHLAAGVSC